MDLSQLSQIAGAAAILVAFAMSQFHWRPSDSYPYILLNLAGGLLLLVSAIAEAQLGFIILEFAWSSISAWSLLGRLRAVRTVA